MTPKERVFAALSHQEPDRVPFFLLLSLHGAKELGLPIREYFSRPENVVEGQVRLQQRFGHDCLYAFFYAPIEVEAWGGEVVWHDDGPPNSGEPMARSREDVFRLRPPAVSESPVLRRALEAIEGLRRESADRVPVIGVVMSPFSLPVMQLGFDLYLDLLHQDEAAVAHLLEVNRVFCTEWANAQLRAGADGICFYDPVCSPTCVASELSRRVAFPLSRRTLSEIRGPVVTHLASGRVLPVVGDLAATGTLAVGAGPLDDLAEVKAACRGRLGVFGNLNGIEMRRWTSADADRAVRDALRAAAPGGGFILSDGHGEIPWQVPDDVLAAISDSVRSHGAYPLRLREG
ncbi:MAG: uroporphyrinogen decarboxylase family protein [Deferrisomatales bacterium]